jgi:DNA polymerase III subunit chi
MTTVDFYFNAPDRLQVACRLAGKALAQKKKLLIYSGDAELAARMDKLLWTWPAIGFVPHCALHEPLAAETPILIGSSHEAPDECQLLLNLSTEPPPHFERFERLLEVVGPDETERNAARDRYRFYRDRGYPIANHDLSGSARGGE